MRPLMHFIAVFTCAATVLSWAVGQQPAAQPGKDYSTSPIVVKMMEFNKKKDGKLTKEEVTDSRLHRLFDQADTNKDGVVTREELMALAAKMEAEFGQDGPGGKGGKGGKGPGGKGDKGGKGPGGKGGPPQPGQVLPSFIADQLDLTGDQKKQVADLQKEVDGQLDKLLTEPQRKQLKAMREQGSGGPPK